MAAQNIASQIAHVLKEKAGKPLCFECLTKNAKITTPQELLWLRACWNASGMKREQICSVCGKKLETM